MENIPTEPRDRPAEETDMEVTPEMIEAGVAALSAFDFRFDSSGEAVAAVFRAMKCAFKAE